MFKNQYQGILRYVLCDNFSKKSLDTNGRKVLNTFLIFYRPRQANWQFPSSAEVSINHTSTFFLLNPKYKYLSVHIYLIR